VRDCTKMRQDWRVEFVCGRRAARVSRHDFQLLHRVAEELGCAPEDVPASVQRAIGERDLNFKNMRTLLQRVAEADAAAAVKSAKVEENGIRVIAQVFGEGNQPEYLNSFATEIAKSDKAVALLGMSAEGNLLFAQHPAAGKDINALLKQVLAQFAGKGGGTRDFARGKLNDATQAEKAVAFAAKQVASGS
jgi:alanyl-tRNA synthetase